LYHRLAEELDLAAATVMARERKERETKDHKAFGFGNLGWLQGVMGIPDISQRIVASLATGLLVLALLIGGVFFLLGRFSVQEGMPGDMPYRSLAISCEQPLARVSFRPDASWSDIAMLLREAKLEIAFGPSEIGEIWLALPSGEPYEAKLDILKASNIVEDLLVTPAKESRLDCR
jgi:hypothetical protein